MTRGTPGKASLALSRSPADESLAMRNRWAKLAQQNFPDGIFAFPGKVQIQIPDLRPSLGERNDHEDILGLKMTLPIIVGNPAKDNSLPVMSDALGASIGVNDVEHVSMVSAGGKPDLPDF